MTISRRTFVKVGVVTAGVAVVGGGGITAATWAPAPELVSERTGSGMSKVLVTYATKSGSVSEIAKTIGETLGAKAQVDVRPIADAGDTSGYDAVVVGSGVRAGNWHQAAKDFVKANADTLKGKHVAFFTVGLTQATSPEKAPEVKAYTDALIAETGVQPVDVGPFAGWFVADKFSFMDRGIMKMMKAPQGDFRDIPAVKAWAESLSPKLGLA